jgi:hypothetical protein
MFTPTPAQLAALVIVNEKLREYGCSPLSEPEIRDWNITGDESEADLHILASDISHEDHTTRCENKFWMEHDWQRD